jgi:hypothetical protein
MKRKLKKTEQAKKRIKLDYISIFGGTMEKIHIRIKKYNNNINLEEVKSFFKLKCNSKQFWKNAFTILKDFENYDDKAQEEFVFRVIIAIRYCRFIKNLSKNRLYKLKEKKKTNETIYKNLKQVENCEEWFAHLIHWNPEKDEHFGYGFLEDQKAFQKNLEKFDSGQFSNYRKHCFLCRRVTIKKVNRCCNNILFFILHSFFAYI